MEQKAFYLKSLSEFQRYKSREVMVGNIGIGGNNPIRIQSMTTTDTMDTEATVKECVELIEAGCEIVRITAPGVKEAENLRKIKEELAKLGHHTPLVADIHFTPKAAEVAATIIEKVRVNPGNYVDKKKFKIIEYDDITYQKDVSKIRKRFAPLVEICKKHGTAMRIGTNHGSLSDRILSRYGDTPEGMVESAMEFLRICKEMDYLDVVLSMKASNTIIMMQAYRLLIVAMEKEGMNFPLHLGVTEAGDGDDGRIKSAVGMGALLMDGIGDTVRVSLTEAPVFEIPVAQEMVKQLGEKTPAPNIKNFEGENDYNPYHFERRKSIGFGKIGSGKVPVVVSDLSDFKEITLNDLEEITFQYFLETDKWTLGDQAPDFVCFDQGNKINMPEATGVIKKAKEGLSDLNLFSVSEYQDTAAEKRSSLHNFVLVNAQNLEDGALFQDDPTVVWVLYSENKNTLWEMRRWILETNKKNKLKHPILLYFNTENTEKLTIQMQAAGGFGALLLDGMVDGLWMKPPQKNLIKTYNQLAFGMLQSSRMRSSKTEYISCPSCGRTLFDLQETTAKVREATEHLKGLKIGVMGCIVNGPGEMADADYGYVGTGVGKISLYKGQEVMKRNLPSEVAVEELINLIRENGDWKEPVR
ncbi:MAG: (E)-4-hydroxy-3-methylbut-2-enyl-diphosphate synthase [Flavobacteriales bacterium]|jgi:(E)-4-hydroxy-3-methylbut-2-enyl-diphosphate synthase|nr:(E)-4-hydroxy-3-methylbut-2-enyl-diphosphate synthase [Flavobacteriales bacterium]